MSDRTIAPEVRQRRLAAIRQAIALGHVGGNEDTEWLLEDVEHLEREIERLKHARVTKRERREWEGIEGDATVLRGYISDFGETPAMTASNREHWKNRAESAEALLLQRAQEIETLQADSEVLRYSNIIEIAVRNETGSVSDYMNHWEGRALKAEAQLTAQAQEIAQVQAAILKLPIFARKVYASTGVGRTILTVDVEDVLALLQGEAARVSRAPQPEQEKP